MSKVFRYYQEEANNAIYEELLVNNKCIVKMFCGTGKSLLMRRCKTSENKNLVVYVFPSLSLIDQFYSDYLNDFPTENMLKISSENEATTDAIKITQFLSKTKNKIICITYQSFKTLMDNLGEIKINVCIFDEAHHAVGETYQKLIFENDDCEKQIFFTATPKNANGIIMYDREQQNTGMCGKLVYDYSYLRGMNEDYLNPFEIRIDMFLENINKSLYESIARAILSSGNNRVLTFHSDVNTERNTSVNNFVNDAEFKLIFKEIQQKEFPKIKKYKKISMFALTASVNGKERRKILDTFDGIQDNEVILISSCETIGEGIDTKNANMCVFVDPKSSYVKIIQNIGRIVRKIFGQDKPNSTILIPCWVDKTKYLECNGDKEKCDEVIRQDMSEGGNFNGILNVLSALKQEDEDLYDICLHYPDTYSPQEIKSNLEKQGYTIDEQVGDGTLIETIEHLLDDEIDYENCETDEEMLMNIAEENDVCIEIHTNSLENPVERYNFECESGEVIRLYKSFDEELEEDVYNPIIQKQNKTKRNPDCINGPRRENRMSVKVHTNPDIKVLWNITSELDLNKDICSCVIDCEVVKYDPMEVAIGIVKRVKEREKNGLHLLPRTIRNIKNRTTPDLIQENKDATKLSDFKKALKGQGKTKCSVEVCHYLDTNLLNWRLEQDFDEKAMEHAKEIVKRAKERETHGLHLLPRTIRNIKNRTTPDLMQENKDATKLSNFKKALKGQGDNKCSNEVRDYLDDNLLNWRLEQDFDKKAMEHAKEIVKRAKERVKNKLHLLPKIIKKENRTTPDLMQEHKDAAKLSNLKSALNRNGTGKCSNEVRDYLDDNLLNWRLEQDEKAMEHAKEIVERAKERVKNKLHLLPRQIKKKNRTTPYCVQEHKDATKLSDFKKALKGQGKTKCFDEVRDYLDYNLPGWRPIDDKSDTQSVVSETIEESQEEETFIIKTKKKSMKLSHSFIKKETTEQKSEKVKSEISQLHKKYKTMKSENLHIEFNERPELWNNYHEISEENEKSFPEHEIPRNRVIQELLKIRTKRTKLVVDMGCGKGQISANFSNDNRFQFINYDHVSSNDTIVSCDISNLPLEEDTIEICILSLAMWGSNCKEYIKEANRILESGGKLYIIEPTKRWSEQDENKNIIEGKEGSKLKSLLEEYGFQIVEQSIEKFCMFVCIKN
jgi:ribosomal RNA-processing protein 8